MNVPEISQHNCNMEILAKLFGSAHRVKLLRLFIFNPEESLDLKELALRTKISTSAIRRELSSLESASVISQRSVSRQDAHGNRKIRVKVWSLNPIFPFVAELQKMLNFEITEERFDIAKRFKNCGKIKLIVISGFFLNDPERRVDLVVVGDSLNKSMIEKVIRRLETELGRELNYSILDTEDYQYRLFSGDKFIRDIFDFPFEYVVNKLNL